MNSTAIKTLLITIYTICYILLLKELYPLWDNLCSIEKGYVVKSIWMALFFISSAIIIYDNYKQYKSDVYVMIFTVTLCSLFFSFFAALISPITFYFIFINLYFLISDFVKKIVK